MYVALSLECGERGPRCTPTAASRALNPAKVLDADVHLADRHPPHALDLVAHLLLQRCRDLGEVDAALHDHVQADVGRAVTHSSVDASALAASRGKSRRLA